jgi:hypothetical protein
MYARQGSLVQSTRSTIQESYFFELNANEVTIIDNWQWINVHGMKNQHHVAILLVRLNMLSICKQLKI